MLRIDLITKKSVAGGRSNHISITNMYMERRNMYERIAIGRYITFINIPKVYPMKEKSLCQGIRKFLKRREIERLSSTTMDILASILRCQSGILTYHQ